MHLAKEELSKSQLESRAEWDTSASIITKVTSGHSFMHTKHSLRANAWDWLVEVTILIGSAEEAEEVDDTRITGYWRDEGSLRKF